jgi:hypothetical protein
MPDVNRLTLLISRIRRMKCDEHKPECFKCQISDRKCDGYENPEDMVDRRLRGTPKSSRSLSSTPPAASSTLSVTVLDFDLIGEPNERRSFHHFRIRTADDLSGCFDSNFWNRLVLQLSHSEPAIKHALIALGAAHESYQAGKVNSFTNPCLALQQYNRAISSLSQQLSNPSRRATEVTLICCIIFICFESVRGNYDAALSHLKSGMDILKSKNLAADKGNSGDVPYLDPQTDEDDLIEHFTRLDVSASAFLDTTPQLAMRLSDSLPDLATHRFQDLAEARKYLQRLVNMCGHLAFSNYQYRDNPDLLPVEAEAERVKLMSAVRQWAVQFDALLKSPAMTGLSGRSLQGAFTLILQQKTIFLVLVASPFSDMRMLVPFERDIESIVSIATWLVRTSGPFPESGPKSAFTGKAQLEAGDPPKFTADMGIIAPLYYVAINCPNPSLRQRALDILKIPRREGLWDSVLISSIAEKVTSLNGKHIVDSFVGNIVELAEALKLHQNNQSL